MIALPIVPEKLRPFDKVPAVCFTWIPLVVVPPVLFMFTRMPLVDVLVLPGFCVIAKASAVPLLARVNDVGDARPDASVNPMLLPVVVVIVLPLLYADCRLCDAEEQILVWLEPSTQSAVPDVVGRPLSVRNESESPVKVTPLVPDGERLV